MKKFIYLAAALFLTSTAFASPEYVVTCDLKSFSVFEDQTSANFNKCSNGASVRLIGTNNSPCKAADALESLVKGVPNGSKVDIVFQLYSYSMLDGMHEAFFVNRAAVHGGPVIETIGECNNTHIQFSYTR